MGSGTGKTRRTRSAPAEDWFKIGEKAVFVKLTARGAKMRKDLLDFTQPGLSAEEILGSLFENKDAESYYGTSCVIIRTENFESGMALYRVEFSSGETFVAAHDELRPPDALRVDADGLGPVTF